jgi:hypothetical protein
MEDEHIDNVEKGNFSVVYGTPEAWLKKDVDQQCLQITAMWDLY